MHSPPKPSKSQPAEQKSLLTGRRWFDVFVSSSIDPIIIFDDTFKIKFINQSGAFLFSKVASELVGIKIENCGVIGSIVAPALLTVSKSNSGMNCDHKISLGNKLRTFQGSYSPVRDANDKLLGIFTILREVSDNHSKLNRLIASNKRLESQTKVLEIFDIVSEADPSGQLLYVNDQFCKINQYTRSELIGKNYRMINSNTHSKAFFQEMWETISCGQTWLGEIKNRAKDGSTYWVQTIITPIFNENGGIACFLSIQQDITQNRNEIFKLAGAALKFEQILDSNPLMEVILDLSHNITYCNRQFLTLIDYSVSETIGKNWANTFIPAFEKPPIQATLLQLFGYKKPFVRFDSQIVIKNGGTKEVVWRAAAIKNTEGAVYGIHLLGEEKEHTLPATDLLRQNILGYVSHELKGGLVSITSGLELLQDELKVAKSDRQFLQNTLQKIIDRVGHIDDLSKDMMMNLEAGSRAVQVRTQQVSLRTVLLGAWAKIQEENAESRKFSFNLQLPEQDIIVQWDPQKIVQAERNLLANAIQYSSPEGGTITLSARQTQENILISVSDEGIGVPSENIASIFNLFTRGSNATSKRRIKHFGIGLNLCKEIAEQHQGRIWIESKLNFGTTIFMLLPINSQCRSPC